MNGHLILDYVFKNIKMLPHQCPPQTPGLLPGLRPGQLGAPLEMAFLGKFPTALGCPCLPRCPAGVGGGGGGEQGQEGPAAPDPGPGSATSHSSASGSVSPQPRRSPLPETRGSLPTYTQHQHLSSGVLLPGSAGLPFPHCVYLILNADRMLRSGPVLHRVI